MRRNGLLQGNTTEEKLLNIDRVLCQLMNRSSKDVGVRVAPNIINIYLDKYTEQTILNYLFPVCGNIDSITFCIDGLKEKVNCDVELSFEKSGKGVEKHVLCPKKLVQTFPVGKRIEIGTKLSVQFLSPVEFTGFWMSFVFNVDIMHAKLHTAIVEEVEKNYEKLQKDLSIDKRITPKAKQANEFGLSTDGDEFSSRTTGSGVIKSYNRSTK